MTAFADRAKQFATTAAQIARLRGASEEAAVLERAAASLVETGYDNWNGGTTFYTFMLELPVPYYVSIEPRRDELEQSILARVAQFGRVEIGNGITAVVISPMLTDEVRATTASAPTDDSAQEETPSFWQPGFFRLFISHLAASKEKAHRLKNALARFQIAAFVAHDDIVPTREWQAEIESALRTMDALVALVEPEFVNSRWCDQEVGVAMGRGKLVVPLRVGADPHGFMGKYQGVQATGLDDATLSERIFEALVAHTTSSARMVEALVERTINSQSYADAKRNTTLLERVPRLTSLQITRLMQALQENGELKDAFGVPARIEAIVKRLAPDSA